MKTHDEREEQIERPNQGSSTKAALSGFLLGGLIGAGTALLLAPQAGEKTRLELQQGATKIRDRTRETVKNAVDQAKSRSQQVAIDLRTTAEGLQQRGKDQIVKGLDRVTAAAESGKKALHGE